MASEPQPVVEIGESPNVEDQSPTALLEASAAASSGCYCSKADQSAANASLKEKPQRLLT